MHDTDHLRTFVTVAVELDIGRASERLGVPGRTLRHRLSALEEAVGVRLVDRSHGPRIGLTQAGSALLPAARDALEAARQFERRADRVRGGRVGTVRVLLLAPCCDDVHRLLAAMREVDPAWSVDVVPLGAPDRTSPSTPVVRTAAARALGFGWVECVIARGLAAPVPRAAVGDARDHGFEPVRVARIGRAGPGRLTVTCRAAWTGAHAAALDGAVAALRTRMRSVAGATGEATG